jgi:chromosome segregation ATPase
LRDQQQSLTHATEEITSIKASLKERELTLENQSHEIGYKLKQSEQKQAQLKLFLDEKEKELSDLQSDHYTCKASLKKVTLELSQLKEET